MVITKADVYEKVIFAERPVCPHCDKEMKIWKCTDTGLSCGSGWGTPYLFVCFNDECPAFVNGWETMKRDYGRHCSYRCICFPGSQNTEMMMVFSHIGGKADIVDEALVTADRARGTAEDPAVQQLARFFESNDAEALMANLLDENTHYKVRLKAAELIGELGLLKPVEQLRCYKFKNQRINAAVCDAIKRIHEINRTRECPYCAEIIEAKATACGECGKELS